MINISNTLNTHFGPLVQTHATIEYSQLSHSESYFSIEIFRFHFRGLGAGLGCPVAEGIFQQLPVMLLLS